MKFFAFIMAVLILVMGVMPCADGAIAMSKEKTELKSSNHQQSNHNRDACSPFCQCACCAGFAINHFFPAFTTIPLIDGNHKIIFLLSDVIEIALPIWQPPQLV